MLPHDEAGSGPALVLLHAGVCDRRMWADHLKPLAAAGYRVVALDLPGFGDAEVVPGEQAPWLDVLRALDHLGIGRAALVGNSFGGAVAQRVALVAPERVSALALISAPAPDLEPSEELESIWATEEEALENEDLDAAARAVADGWTLPDAPQALRDQVAAMQRRAYELQEGADVSEAPDPLEENPQRLSEIDAPTLIAAGDRDKGDFIAGAESMAEAMPNARHELIAGAGHLAPLETPEQFRELLLDFLRSSG
ncbi:MAG TPA: alpha/beta hydrolase [Thermoleophilaceae bacterium]